MCRQGGTTPTRAHAELTMELFSGWPVSCGVTCSHVCSRPLTQETMEEWSVAQVCDYFRGLGMADTSRLVEKRVSGRHCRGWAGRN